MTRHPTPLRWLRPRGRLTNRLVAAVGLALLLVAPAERAEGQEPTPVTDPPGDSPTAPQPVPPPEGDACPNGTGGIGWPGYLCYDAQLGFGNAPAGCPGGSDDPPYPGTSCPDGSMPAGPPYGCPGGGSGTPVPGTVCPDGSMPHGPPAPAGCRFGVPASPEEGTVCPDGSAPRDRVAEQHLRNILGLDEDGEGHPLESYDIGCDEGAWNSLVRKMWCGAQAMPFALGKWAIGLGVELLGWALEFRLAEGLAPIAGLLSRLYDTSLVGPLQLRDLGWTMALFVGGWHLMRARAAQGIAEVATTVLVAAVGGILLANPQGYLEGSVELAQNTSGAVLEAVSDVLADGTTDQDAEAVRARLGGILRTSFVAEPYDLINWGGQLTGECAAARDQILEGGPWGSDDEPRDIMRDHGCEAEAEFNAEPSDSRAVASLVVGLAAVVATVLLLAVALVVFVAQLTLVALFAGASLVWALALFPGARELLWWWIGRLAWAVAATIAATFALSWLAVTVTAVLSATSDMSIIQRSLVALLVVAFAFRLRAHLGRMIDQASRRFGDSLSRIGRQAQNRPGFAAAGPSGAGSGSGVGLSMTARSWAFDTPGGQYVFNRLYARHFTRGYRQRGGPIRGTRRALGAARRTARGAGTASGHATRDLRRGARAVVMAPIVGPRAVAATRVRATAASRRARRRLQQARATPPAMGRQRPPPR